MTEEEYAIYRTEPACPCGYRAIAASERGEDEAFAEHVRWHRFKSAHPVVATAVIAGSCKGRADA